MAEDRQRIKILVGEKYYPLNVIRDDEPLYRKAAQSVNARLAKYKEKYRGNASLSILDMMAFAAIDVAVEFMKQDADSNAKVAETELNALIEEMRAFMNTEASDEAFDIGD